MGNLITLAEWSEQIGRSVESVRVHLASQEDFPAPKGTRSRIGMGPGRAEYEYDSDKLADWWANAKQRPAQVAMPSEPEKYRTLGAIARLIGVDNKTVSQYRKLFDDRVDYEVRGKRRYYRTREVIDILNQRRGFGAAFDPAKDKRSGAKDKRSGSHHA